MKTLVSLLAIVSILSMASCSSGYKINVNFADHSMDGKMAYLTNYDSGDTIDSAKVSEKHLALEGSVDTAYFARLIVDGNRLGFIVEPGEINVEWNEQGVATGTGLNDKLNTINAEIDKIDGQWDSISQAFKDNKITEEEATKQSADLENKQNSLFLKTYEDNKDNAIGPWAFTNYLIYKQFNAAQLDSILNTAPSHYRNFKRVKKAVSDAKALDNTAVGKIFTDFALINPDGKEEKLSDVIGKDGNYTLVDFWASWCGPCRVEIKGALMQLHEKYQGKGLQILGVAVWDKPEDTKGAVKQLAIPWQVMMAREYTTVPTDIYGIAGIPHIMLVDPDGKILSRGLQGEALVTYVDQIMASKKQ